MPTQTTNRSQLLKKLSIPIKWIVIATGIFTPIITFAQRPIELLEPVNGTTHITLGGNPFSALNQYLQPFMPVVIGSAAGLAVLMIIIGGFQIMLSGGNIAQSAGKERILAALGGILLLIFSATVLYILNANYFLLSS